MSGAHAQSVPPMPEYPTVVIHAPKVTGSPGAMQGELLGTPSDPVTITYGGEFKVSAQKVSVDQKAQSYLATGMPTVQELTAYLKADTIEFHGATPASGIATSALLVRSPYVIRAKEITLDPQTIVGTDAYFTTAPPNISPAYSIRARRLVLFPKVGRGEILNGSLYLFGTRLVTIPHYKFQYAAAGGQGGRRQLRPPAFGSSSRYGFFGSIEAPAGTWLPVDLYFLLPTRNSPQLRLIASQPIRLKRQTANAGSVVVVGNPGKTESGAPEESTESTESTENENSNVSTARSTTISSSTERPASGRDTLATLRAFALGNGVLPDGDPLLFYQFVPWPVTVKPLDPHPGAGLSAVEQVGVHLATSGNEHNDLFVSRLPEVGISGVLPLTRITTRPTGGDPAEFRRYLRRPVFYAGASSTFGNYLEQPTNIRHDRWQYNAWVNTSPVLIGQNTVIVPQVAFSYNRYGGRQDGYRYAQTSLSLMHYITDRTAFGFDYMLSAVGGSSPFNFDVLDAAQELDARAQVGNKNISVGGIARLDIEHNRVFDYRVTVAPTVRGVIPVLTYDFQNKALDVGLAFEGITF
jgi:hypothetical protein